MPAAFELMNPEGMNTIYTEWFIQYHQNFQIELARYLAAARNRHHNDTIELISEGNSSDDIVSGDVGDPEQSGSADVGNFNVHDNVDPLVTGGALILSDVYAIGCYMPQFLMMSLGMETMKMLLEQ